MRHGRLCVGEELHLDYFECLEVEFVMLGEDGIPHGLEGGHGHHGEMIIY